MTAACLTAFLGTRKARAQDAPDAVLLTNGGRVRGTVMEEDPQKGTSIKLIDGTVKRLAPGDVKQVIYGGSSQAATPPAPSGSSPPASGVPVVVPPVVAAQGAPGVLPAVGAQPVSPHPEYARGTTTLKPLWITGLVLLSTSYLLTITITAGLEAGDGDPRAGTVDGESAVPVFGPWIILADSGNHPSGGQTGALIFSGILQSASLACLVAGLSVHVPKHSQASLLMSEVSLVPWAPSRGSGLSLVGRF